MDFARKQMLKYGWKEGEGIGKEGNQGLKTALKPKYKVGKEGMGYDLSKELVDTWWNRSYADSLERINIKPSQTDEDEGVKVSFIQDESGEDEMSRMRRRMMKSNFQEFSKGAVLDNGQMLEEDNSDSGTDSGIATPSSTSSTTKSVSDEDLFKACGGRTAHKAARFGHKLSGKLARIAAQEEAQLLTLQNSQNQPLSSISTTKVKRKKRSKRKHMVSVEIEMETVDEPPKKLCCKRKKRSSISHEVMAIEENSTHITTNFVIVVDEEEMDHEPSVIPEKGNRRKRKEKIKNP